MRGGTSKALMLHQRDLPQDRDDWAPIFLGAIGAPDPNGRQLDGMGGGVSSLSKVCIIGPPSRSDADVDYTFAQVSVKDAAVDYSGNCGNMSSAVGPFALDEGLVTGGGNEACVRIHNTNTKKIIVSRFRSRRAWRRSTAISCCPGSPAAARRSASSSPIQAAPAPASCCRAARRSMCSRCPASVASRRR